MYPAELGIRDGSIHGVDRCIEVDGRTHRRARVCPMVVLCPSHVQPPRGFRTYGRPIPSPTYRPFDSARQESGGVRGFRARAALAPPVTHFVDVAPATLARRSPLPEPDIEFPSAPPLVHAEKEVTT